MDIISIIIIAICLSMDAFSVCIAAGVKIRCLDAGHYLRLSIHFGLFQFLMPVAGYYGGTMIGSLVKDYDHWIAFGLLSFIGLKMLWESCQKNEGNVCKEGEDPSRGLTLLMLSVATSIDAAAVGFSFATLEIPIFFAAVIIGVICAAISAAGLFLGNKIGSLFGPWAERIGGTVLILIGVKILIEHLL